jgi:hypothetical protein
MATDLDREPNYDLVVEALSEKTVQGKLQWQETAEEGKFIAAVKGERRFELFRDPSQEYVNLGPGRTFNETATLVVRDGAGKELFVVRSDAVDNLYVLVRRIVYRVDEKIEATYELLSHL